MIQRTMIFRTGKPMTAVLEMQRDGRWTGRAEDGVTASADSPYECADKLTGILIRGGEGDD